MHKFFPKLAKYEWLILLAITVGYFALTTLSLTKLPIFVDEALYLRWSQIAWHDVSWRFISLTDGKQPLYIWLVIPFMKLIRDPLFAGRMASVVSGYFTVFGMGYLGWLLKDKKTGLIAMILAALSPYLFFYYRFGIMEATLITSVIWVVNLSILLAKTRRLDVALILGMVTGLSLLVKSSALFFCLLIPFAYLLDFDAKKIFTKKTLRYLGLVLTSWLIAYLIYNIQRLSPWMHMIAEKNAFFTVGYGEIFNEPKRLINNFLDVWRWQISYTTIPVLIFFAFGLYKLFRTNLRTFIYYSSLLLGPVLGTVALASLFAPRYIIYATPFFLIFSAYGISTIKNSKLLLTTLLFVLILPLSLIIKLISDPIHFPYVKVDEGYVNGWSAGNGVKQIADWAVSRIQQTGQPMTIFTEGTFGILPHGLELYADGQVAGLTIRGLYPINSIPPTETIASVASNPETYFILNNTQTTGPQPGLELISEHQKLDPAYSMRLYRVLSTEK